MRTRAVISGLACALAAATAGCGSSGGPEEGGPDPNDKRAVALECFRDEQGLQARPSGTKSIQVDGVSGPRVEFFVTSGEAEGKQFQGGAESAEHIGAALLFVNQASEEQLEKVEMCLEG